MKASLHSWSLLGALALMLVAFTGCESTDGGSSNVGGGVYYGVGFYDPWYYGGYYYDDPDIIVNPPGDRHDWGARPEQPIARPESRPSTRPAATSARPTLSIPSTPRVSGGRR